MYKKPRILKNADSVQNISFCSKIADYDHVYFSSRFDYIKLSSESTVSLQLYQPQCVESGRIPIFVPSQV